MKVNSNLALTLILLTLMFAAGVVSAAYSFALGREGLRGVTQPDTRPNNTLANRKGGAPRRGEVMILKEEEILKQVKVRINGGDVDPEPLTNESQPKQRNPESRSNNNQKTSQKEAAFNDASFTTSVNFPIVSEDRGVHLEVKSVRRQGNSLLLEVNLSNQSDRPVRFLYSFLDITDDRGRSLSASATGLPTELPAQSETFAGTVNVPTALLDDAKELSLALTDYPDQRLQLKMAGIPVVK